MRAGPLGDFRMPVDLKVALSRMRSVLVSLDATEAPADIGAHLDMAACRLEAYLETLPTVTLLKPAA
jgi:hypothetical protein